MKFCRVIIFCLLALSSAESAVGDTRLVLSRPGATDLHIDTPDLSLSVERIGASWCRYALSHTWKGPPEPAFEIAWSMKCVSPVDSGGISIELDSKSNELQFYLAAHHEDSMHLPLKVWLTEQSVVELVFDPRDDEEYDGKISATGLRFEGSDRVSHGSGRLTGRFVATGRLAPD